MRAIKNALCKAGHRATDLCRQFGPAAGMISSTPDAKSLSFQAAITARDRHRIDEFGHCRRSPRDASLLNARLTLCKVRFVGTSLPGGGA
jgi:hypothetical protein